MSLVMTEDGFEQEVRRKVKEEGLSFVIAVYETLDEYLEFCRQNSPVKLACGKGCPACCYQLVVCTPSEWIEIKRYVQSISPSPKRRLFIDRVREAARPGSTTLIVNQPLVERNPLKGYDLLFGKPCPFLDVESGDCTIYPVRPLDCRTTSATTRCTLSQLYAERFRFPPELWANQLLMKEEMSKPGYKGAPAIHIWIVDDGFNK